jgi:hypothetical protein
MEARTMEKEIRLTNMADMLQMCKRIGEQYEDQDFIQSIGYNDSGQPTIFVYHTNKISQKIQDGILELAKPCEVNFRFIGKVKQA